MVAQRACSRCGDPFKPSRAAQTACRSCRQRLALERHAARRVAELERVEAALQMAIGVVQRDLDGWRNVQAGSPRKRGQWRRARTSTRGANTTFNSKTVASS